MSTKTIRHILESELDEIIPSVDTQHENEEFTPVDGVPYQQVFILYAKPDNAYVTKQFNQPGFMQVNLRYPELVGSGHAQERAELIRSKFKAGSIFSGVKITATPEIGRGNNQDGRYVVPVFVNFSQHIQET